MSEETNYRSGDDYLVEFLGFRFSFNADDFEQRVTAAAVKLGLLAGNELDDDETADLVELVERDAIEEPRSALGRYLVRRWDEVSLVEGESLVYWLTKLVFRGAWLDHRVKEGKLEVGWEDDEAEFSYRDPHGGRPPVSQAARASPAGPGSGSRSVLLPLPVTVISPARQSMSPSWSPAASAPRRPSRASSDKIA